MYWLHSKNTMTSEPLITNTHANTRKTNTHSKIIPQRISNHPYGLSPATWPSTLHPPHTLRRYNVLTSAHPQPPSRPRLSSNRADAKAESTAVATEDPALWNRSEQTSSSQWQVLIRIRTFPCREPRLAHRSAVVEYPWTVFTGSIADKRLRTFAVMLNLMQRGEKTATDELRSRGRSTARNGGSETFGLLNHFCLGCTFLVGSQSGSWLLFRLVVGCF